MGETFSTQGTRIMNIKITDTDEKIVAGGGLIAVGMLLENLELAGRLAPLVMKKHKRALTPFDAIACMIGLQVQGHNRYESVELFRGNEFFAKSLQISQVPSAPALRQNLDKLADTAIPPIQATNLDALKKAKFTPIKTSVGDFIPIDPDVSCLDNSGSNKELVGWTYKKHDGYAPILAYIGAEGYMLNCELRPGVQHCQNNTPQFLARTLAMAEKLGDVSGMLWRLDSGNDAVENVEVLFGKTQFIIKRNLRREPREQWLETAKSVGEAVEERPGKIVYSGTVSHLVPGNKEGFPCVDVAFKVTHRTIDRDGNAYLECCGEIEVETYWTSLPVEATEVIEFYHAHGTSEQFHSELKTDMNVERLPSGKYKSNELNLQIAMLSFNILRLLGQMSLGGGAYPLKRKVERRRLGSVIRDIILIAGKFVKTGRDFFFRIWSHNPWLPAFRKLQLDLSLQ